MKFCNSANSKIRLLRSIFSFVNIRKLVDQPTRVPSSSVRLLDNVVTNFEIFFDIDIFDNFDLMANLFLITRLNQQKKHICQPHKQSVLQKDFICKRTLLSLFTCCFRWIDVFDVSQDVDWNFEKCLSTLHTFILKTCPLKTFKTRTNTVKKFFSEQKAFADSNVDLAILARDSKDPNFKLHLQKRRQLFKRLLLKEDCTNMSNWI